MLVAGEAASDDGGLTWTASRGRDSTISWGREAAETPLGVYAIEGSDITLSRAGEKEVVYSSVVKSRKTDLTALGAATRHLGFRTVSVEPHAIFYDERSGNIVLAMGLQGMLVGTPDREWMRITVGDYKPVDFSLVGRAKRLLEMPELLAIALALSMTFLGFILTVVVLPRDINTVNALAIVIVSIALISFLMIFIIRLMVQGDAESFGISVLVILLLMMTIGLLNFTRKKLDLSLRAVLFPIISLLHLVPTALALLDFSELSTGSDISGDLILIPMSIFSLMVAVVVTILALSNLEEPSIQITAVIVSFLLMMVLCYLAFFMWISGNIGLTPVKISAVALVATAAVVLSIYMRHEGQARS